MPYNRGKCGDCCCGSGLYRIFMSIIFLFLIHPQMYLDNFLEISLPLLYLYDNATKLMQYQGTEFPQRFSSLIILFIVIDLYFLFHRVLVKLLPRTTFQISVFPC